MRQPRRHPDEPNLILVRELTASRVNADGIESKPAVRIYADPNAISGEETIEMLRTCADELEADFAER